MKTVFLSKNGTNISGECSFDKGAWKVLSGGKYYLAPIVLTRADGTTVLTAMSLCPVQKETRATTNHSDLAGLDHLCECHDHSNDDDDDNHSDMRGGGGEYPDSDDDPDPFLKFG